MGTAALGLSSTAFGSSPQRLELGGLWLGKVPGVRAGADGSRAL